MAEARPIREVMTRVVKTVDMTATVRDAHDAMKDAGIRHLPVLDGDRFVGVLSSRELEMLRLLPISDVAISSVADAMRDDPYVVAPEMSVRDVVHEMRRNKYGSAIVVDDGAVAGIFTTMDALAIVEHLFE